MLDELTILDVKIRDEAKSHFLHTAGYVIRKKFFQFRSQSGGFRGSNANQDCSWVCQRWLLGLAEYVLARKAAAWVSWVVSGRKVFEEIQRYSIFLMVLARIAKVLPLVLASMRCRGGDLFSTRVSL